MSGGVKIQVEILTDENGLLGRECPKCKKYFKVKPGTGLSNSTCICPYCQHKAESDEFFTEDQTEYFKSIVLHKVVKPMLDDWGNKLEQSFKKSSFLKFKFSGRDIEFPIQYYSEKDLETSVICDSCNLSYAIYGVFDCCPDCGRYSTMGVFRKSLEVSKKRLALLKRVPNNEEDLYDALLVDALNSGVSIFDSLGKYLRNEYPKLLPQKPINLFQNLAALNLAIVSFSSRNLNVLIGESEYSKIQKMFQVRHIWAHNFGEIDEDFIRKTECSPEMLGRKYKLDKREVEETLQIIEQAGIKIREILEEYNRK